ncbi:uncharacterized protein LOC113565144 [Drosophila persimilis]|uniref:uncharacterized protein LOC113565144 n=1 Tax=Drosophila persimilis TaxID=7234 RepID=UPI000F08BF6F|nr:uncharacterized protein LOC113565144 [Drosophila persimilis]
MPMASESMERASDQHCRLGRHLCTGWTTRPEWNGSLSTESVVPRSCSGSPTSVSQIFKLTISYSPIPQLCISAKKINEIVKTQPKPKTVNLLDDSPSLSPIPTQAPLNNATNDLFWPIFNDGPSSLSASKSSQKACETVAKVSL